ncbi:lytic transglycosylase domain-containing protein [Pseudodonghicola flavimaris]|uniref:Lytic transglycosylase domain-containing protein n=1 Tax=Pseudodonghicola flavimaris TaxID=3050036 RepID=A0ABT7EWP4_9RHOB|nr:lytic transglycosylase domain-containing protein [Pseudodonghicola flavimaris]MDK3016709.1 lytic transglycosylase domain-containing protein [Pseudodonghicola flavimaris]
MGVATVAIVAGAGGWGGLPARAEFFSGFYTSSAPQPEPVARAPQAAAVAETGADCIAAILDAQARYGIPDNLLLAIGVQEAGRRGAQGLTVWPWTVNAEGEGAFFRNKQEAIAWVRARQAAGQSSIDVGCMQVNQRWHGEAFTSLAEAFDPQANVDYAARYLRSLFDQTGTWWAAAGRYHSATEGYQTRYLTGLRRNQAAVQADLGRLIAQARGAAMFNVAATAEPVAPLPLPPVYWGSAGGDGRRGERFSIYSSHPIRAVLPDYKVVN